jgi:hypothetical protein
MDARQGGTRWVCRGALLFLVAIGLPGLGLFGACGGGDGGGSGVDDNRPQVASAYVKLSSSNAAGAEGLAHFALPVVEEVEEGGQTWSRLGIPGCAPCSTQDGHPEVAGLRFFLLLPHGATPQVEIAEPTVVETRSLKLYPNQPLAGEFHEVFDTGDEPTTEEEHWFPPFVHDPGAYATNMPFPEVPCRVRSCGELGSLRFVVVEVAGGQYEPTSGQLQLYGQVHFRIGFTGGTGDYVDVEAGNPFEAFTKLGAYFAENASEVMPIPFGVPQAYSRVGEELLILTTVKYASAANRLAEHRRGQGMLTRVYFVNDGGGPAPDTAQEIDAWIDDHWDECLVRPSYLLLFGDAADIPTFILPRRYSDVDFASDFPYGNVHTNPLANDFFWDIAVGRIPVNSAAQAETVVDKLIEYDSSGSGLIPAPHEVTIASEFQCCGDPPPVGREDRRSFLRRSEDVFIKLGSVGYDVERIYATHVAGEYADDPTPRRWRDGSLLPPPLRPEDGFAWDGDTQDVIDAFNTRRLFIIHHDHGGVSGWGHPYFTTTHFGSLTNGYYPVVVSSNCSSGRFDDYDCFSERLLRLEDAGASAVFAFTRMSNSGVTADVIHGFVNALYPHLYGDFGNIPVRDRCGDVLGLMRARITLRIIGQDPESNAFLGAWCYLRMITLFGDPSMKIRTQWSPPVLPGEYVERTFFPDRLEVVYAEDGVELTAMEYRGPDAGWRPIGRAMVANGRAVLPYVEQPVQQESVRIYTSRHGSPGKPLDPPPP